MTITDLVVVLQAQAEEWDGRTKVFTVDRTGDLVPIAGVHVEADDPDLNPRLVIET